ncbi:MULTISPECIES: zinc ribbon domain-containing protein [unclassified Microbacterium]|uniref:zinc ribbon domain-containing protein n=1 Tax=unclassified Microbacterium TaxID=2609290 RepID=UPI0009607FFB|nr:C4-type zinc ribbon domain-containing protein [Microbacterium sp. 67-17]OJV98651.1 MAG: DNA-binding protein [Microbacterium sp. 67-17]
MNASPDDQRRLLEVAALDARTRAASAAARSPEQAARISELMQTRTELNQDLVRARGAVDDVRAEQRRLDDDLKVVEARIARDATRLADSANAKEAQNLEHELAALARRKSDLEDADLEAMERAEAAEEIVAGLEARLREVNEEGASLSAGAKAAVSAAQADEAAATRDREAVASTVDPDLLGLYDKLAQRSAGAALLTRQTCGGCHMVLAGSDLSALRAAAPEAVVTCPECGCILVRTEESGL